VKGNWAKVNEVVKKISDSDLQSKMLLLLANSEKPIETTLSFRSKAFVEIVKQCCVQQNFQLAYEIATVMSRGTHQLEAWDLLINELCARRSYFDTKVMAGKITEPLIRAYAFSKIADRHNRKEDLVVAETAADEIPDSGARSRMLASIAISWYRKKDLKRVFEIMKKISSDEGRSIVLEFIVDSLCEIGHFIEAGARAKEISTPHIRSRVFAKVVQVYCAKGWLKVALEMANSIPDEYHEDKRVALDAIAAQRRLNEQHTQSN
jgi:hypothetical protein